MRRGIAIGVLGACAWLLAACERRGESEAVAVVSVRTARVVSGTVTDWVRLFGRVVPPPDQEATLAPLVAGALTSVPVREGQGVKAREVVARVEPSLLDDAVRAAEAGQRRAAAEAEFRRRAAVRGWTLVEKGVESRQEAESDESAAVAAESALAEAESALATAHRRRDWSELRAPFDGVVLHVMRRPGDTVDGTPATPVVQLASPAGAQVAADATAAGLARIEPGQIAEIQVRGEAVAPVPGRVLRRARSVDPVTGSGEVRLAFDAPQSALALGLGVEVRIAVRRAQNAAVVPLRALRRSGDGGSEAVVVDNGKAAVRPVTTGLAEGDRVEIASGLVAGETVVVDDPVGLADGSPVRERP